MLHKFLFLGACFIGGVLGTPNNIDRVVPIPGNWSVGDCILASFNLSLTIYPNNTNTNSSIVVTTSPKKAKAIKDEKQCGNDTQTLALSWSDTLKNGTSVDRNVTVIFKKNGTYYGISQIFGYVCLGAWKVNVSHTDPKTNVTKNTTETHSNYVTFDTSILKKMLLVTPLKNSYLCVEPNVITINSFLHQNDATGPPGVIPLTKPTLIRAKYLQFDAFRTKDAPQKDFQKPLDCDYHPNDIVPIAVGCSLALLVVIVLISYLVGRRRAARRGYQSV